MQTDHATTGPKQPKPPPNPDRLEHALTFFVTSAQRRAVLARLRTHSDDRVRGLLIALGIAEPAAPAGGDCA